MKNAENETPVMMQYKRIKAQYPDAILFFRLGDFYEMFDEQAVEVSKLLNLTLTQRHPGQPMCGVPYHAAKVYIARLLRHGKRVAVCEQVSVPNGRTLTERKVVEVITPGTVVEDDYLDKSENNFVAALVAPKSGTRRRAALAWLDVSTAVFQAASWDSADNAEELAKHFARIAPSELLLPQSLQNDPQFSPHIQGVSANVLVSYYPDWHFSAELSYKRLLEQFKTANLNAFALDEGSPEVVPAGFLLDYARKNTGTNLEQVRGISLYHDERFLALDSASRKNLELTANLRDGTQQYTLFEVLNHTSTPMGARLLRSHLFNPLTDAKAIARRQDEVEFFALDRQRSEAVRKELNAINDVERLSSRIGMERAHGKDLQALRSSLRHYLEMRKLCADFSLFARDDEPAKRIIDLIGRAVIENPSVVLTEGNLIARGWSEELDRLHAMQSDFSAFLEEYLEEERQKTGISSLKIRYNRQTGYYIEVTKANLSAVPEHFMLRRAYVNGERYTTARLQELERELLSAAERIIELERELFVEVRNSLKQYIPHLFAYAAEIAALDVTVSHALCAQNYRWVRPLVDDSDSFAVEQGRHPVVERHLPEGSFVPNSLNLDAQRFALITGPNMAGKSTYLRQNALIALLAQIGSFVPAKSAHIGVLDKIFCRVGASDNLARGESTFLVEMTETANILRSATAKSLVIMDEVGRGTSTEDGLSIAWAVSEFLLNSIRAKTLFATHYHELTRLEHPDLQLLCLEVLEAEGEVVFLKRIKSGAAENSYGLHVATLAGVPAPVVARAQQLIAVLQQKALEKPLDVPQAEVIVPTARQNADALAAAASQFAAPGLFSDEELVLDEILSANPDELTPLQALQKLAKWKKMLAATV